MKPLGVARATAMAFALTMRFARAMRFALAMAFALVMLASTANAQRLFGTVVLANDRTPAGGAIIEATDAGGTIVARELASGRGDYIMPLNSAGTYTLTARRVGSEPEVMRGVVVAAGADVRARIILAHPTPRPARVTARTDETCNVAGGTGVPALLWNQLQTALVSTSMAEQSRLFVGSWTLSQHIIDGNLRDTISRKQSAERLPIETSVMPTLSPDSARRHGYVIEAPQGVLYHVPGVTMLRSSRFVEARCFAAEPAPADQPGWIGVHFRPEVGRTGLSDVEGNVWFDAATLEPQRLEFVYTGLPPTFAPARSGGSATFRRLATGHWVTDTWTIRVPSGRYYRMFEYDTRGVPSGAGNIALIGVQSTTATLQAVLVNGATIYRRP